MIDIGNPVSRDSASVINANNPTVDDSALPRVLAVQWQDMSHRQSMMVT